MLKFRKKLLAVILTASMLVSMSQTVAWSAADDSAADASASDTLDTNSGDDNTDPTASDSENDKEDEDDKDDKDEVVVLSDEEGLAQMKVYAENDNLVLYLNEETLNFALKVKEDNYIWWAMPLNPEADTVAKTAQIKTLKSPIVINYGDPVDHKPTKLNAFDGCIKSKKFNISKIDNGFRIDFNFSRPGIKIPLQVVLNNDSFDVQILTQEIEEKDITSQDGSILLDVTLLGNFGSAGMDETGYMVVPDGSGAVINFNNNKTYTQAYASMVYGRDTSVGQLTKPAIAEQVYLPVTGLVKENESGKDHAFLAVVDKGDTASIVNASISRQNTTSENSTWFDFTMRTQDTFYMGANNRKLTVYESGNIKLSSISVRYYPITGDELSYVDLANTYRNYLTGEKGLKAKTENLKDNYYLDIHGGTVKTQSVAGFPVDQQTAATTYSQAQTILQKLKDQGVADIVVKYNNFTTSGIVSEIATNTAPAGILGGNDQFMTLKNFMDENKYQLFPDIDVMEFENSGNGYSFTLNASKQVTNAYATQNDYDLAYGIPKQLNKRVWVTLSPYYLPDVFRKITDYMIKDGVGNISLSKASTMLYSDFSRDIYTREETAEILTTEFNALTNSDTQILAQASNAYMLPYVDYLTDIPLYSSNYDLFDYDIPFYQLVIHGLIPYTTRAINSSADASELILLSISTGTPVHFDMMYADPNDFTDSEYDNLFYANYEGWIESSANVYKLFKDTAADVVNQKIVSHKYIDKNIIETTFENGKVVTIDKHKNTLEVDGKKIDLTQYGLKGDKNE